jgi:transposase
VGDWNEELSVWLAPFVARLDHKASIAQWFRQRVGELQGRTRRAIIAMARKLLIAIWWFVTQGIVPEGAILAA